MQKPVYERILKEQRDAQNSVSNGGADRKADKGKRYSVTGVFFTYKRDFLSDRETFDKLLGIDTVHNLTLFGFRFFDRDDLSVFSICRIHGKVRVIAVRYISPIRRGIFISL